MRYLLVVFALFLCAASASAQSLDRLVVKDSKLIDSQGRQVVLHGVNVVYKLSPYYPNSSGGARTSFTKHDAALLRSWGMNTIRLGVTWKALEPTPGSFDAAYAEKIARIAELAGRYGIYTLIDMHQDLYAEEFNGNGAPSWAIKSDDIPFSSLGPFPLNYYAPAVGRSFTNFWENKDGIRTAYVKTFAKLARLFKNKRYILGYDTFNEPVCDMQTAPCGLPPQTEATRKWLKPFYDEIYPALTKVDPTHPVFYEEGVQVNFGWPFHFGSTKELRWPYKNAGLSFHSYCSEIVRTDIKCAAQETSTLSGAQQAGRSNSVAPLMTEFGATDDLPTLERLTALADRYGVGWQYWQYKTYDDPTTQAGSDAIKADAESIVDREGKIKTAKVRVLARPYPERIGGTTARWKFDPKTKVFSFSYRPEHRSVTHIKAPYPIYPKGVEIEVKGASAVYNSVTEVVNLNPKKGAKKVVLKLTPTL